MFYQSLQGFSLFWKVVVCADDETFLMHTFAIKL